jgi:hypothetical protein
LLDLPHWFNLNHREFERQFALPAVELKEIVALDDMELLPEQSLLRIRSHDLHGPLPEIILQVDPADRLGAFEALGREVVRLCAVTRLRRELDGRFQGQRFCRRPEWTANASPGFSGTAGRCWSREGISCRRTTGGGGGQKVPVTDAFIAKSMLRHRW